MPGRVQLFGAPQLVWNETPVTAINTNRLQSLFAFLILRAATPQPREQLAALLWPESSDGQARTNLRQLLHHLRRALPADCSLLISDRHAIQWLRRPECSVDVQDFDDALKRAAQAGQSGDEGSERAALETAAALYRDELARGLYDDWLIPLREDYRQQFASALARLVVLLEQSHEFDSAILYAERLIALDPLREAHHQLLIRLHIANHDRAAALRAFHRCLRVLRTELGVDPAPATRELYTRALQSDAPEPVKTPRPAATADAIRMVGRQNEWKQLLDCWRSVESGESRLAVITGEPGIGKTRLAEALYERCAATGRAAARARCYAAHGRLAYAPVAEWLRAQPLRAAVSQLPQVHAAHLARLLPEILAGESQPQRLQAAESWERRFFFEALHAAFRDAPHPLLLFLDDLQWCDVDTIDYLHALFGSSEARRILVVATLRSEETGRDHPATRLRSELARSGQVTEIPLAPLSDVEASELARRIAGHSIAPDDMDHLYRTTRGNPLFIVESIRAGLRQPEAARRIDAVISARLGQLSAPAYEIAGWAAAAGRALSFDLLAKATDWDEDSLSRALDELWRRRLIESVNDALYDFTHDRIRDVAAAELSPIRKRFFHRRIARAIEELNADDLSGVSVSLASHYEDAGMPDEALAYYLRAANVARQRFADQEAAALLRRALSLCNSFPESARRDALDLELSVNLGAALVTTLGYAAPEVGGTYQRALDLSLALKEKERLPFALSGSWIFHVVRGEFEGARRLGQQLLDFAEGEANDDLGAAADFALGCTLFHLGELASSYRRISRAASAYRGGSQAALALFAGRDLGVFCRAYLAHLCWHQGHPDHAASTIQDAIGEATRIASPFSIALALDYAALLFTFARQSKLALKYARHAISVCRRHDFAYYRSMAEIVAGWAAAVEEDARSGLEQLRAGLEMLRSTGAEIRLPFYYGLLAEICALNGNMGEALANLSTAFAFQNKNGEMWCSADLHAIQGDLLLHTKNPEQARQSYRNAVEAALRVGSVMLEQRARSRLKQFPDARTTGNAF
jgi:DNA-binding SARP family transcriptional activator